MQHQFDFAKGGVEKKRFSTLVYVGGGILFMQYRGFEAFIPYDILPWFFVRPLVTWHGSLPARLAPGGSTGCCPLAARMSWMTSCFPALTAG